MTEPLPILILPTWRYHAMQGGKIFRTEAELAEAEAQGWRDSPAAAKAPLDVYAMPDDGVSNDEVMSKSRLKRLRIQRGDGPADEAIEVTADGTVIAALEAAEALIEQGETGAIEDALEAAEDAIEKVQAAVSKKRKRKS